MTWINNNITLEQAVAAGLDVWELMLTNFGSQDDTFQSPDGTDMVFPALGNVGLSSVAAIAIGPQSTVDRCFIGINPQVQVGTQEQADFTPHRVSREAPLLFPQGGDQRTITSLLPAPLVAAPNQAPTGSLSVNAEGSVLGSFRDNLSTNVFWNPVYDDIWGTGRVFPFIPSAFGPAAVIADPQCKFVTPFLHLLFYTRPPSIPPPTKRIRAYWETQRTLAAGAPGDRVLAFQFPVMGRRQLSVNLFTDAVGVDYVIGGVLFPTMREIPLATGSLVQNVRSRIPIQVSGIVDYLMIHYIKNLDVTTEILSVEALALD